MSKYEQTEYIDDRYKAMDERLKVRNLWTGCEQSQNMP